MKLRVPSFHDILVSIGFLVVLAAVAFAGKWAWNTYRNPRAEVDFKRYPVRGLDLSAHNGEVDFGRVAAAGIRFVWLKASEGETLRDAAYRANSAAAAEAGILVGAYHFFRFDCDGVMQAMNLCSALNDTVPPLGVAIDVELENNASGVDDKTIVTNLESMVDYLGIKGIPVTFYTNKEGYSRFIKNNFGDYPLWICSFTDREPFDDDTPWNFWQYSHKGRVDGIRGNVDENVFNGTLPQLRTYTTAK